MFHRLIDALHHATRGRTVVVATHSAALAHCAETLLVVAGGTVRATPEAIAA